MTKIEFQDGPDGSLIAKSQKGGPVYMNKIHGLIEFTQMINNLIPDYELEAEIIGDEGAEMLMVSCRRLDND